jgi:hypothetical protein
MEGRILDIETQAPVLAYIWQAGAAVALTDETTGAWSADLPAPALLRITAVGYKPLEHRAQANDDQGTLYLEPLVTDLEPVVVTPGPRPDAAGLPWWLIALGAALVLANHRPRRR